jgi:hypothetical protein
LVGKHKSKGSKHRWEDNKKMDLEEILWDCVDCINLAEDKDKWQAGSREHSSDPPGSLKYREFDDLRKF